VPLELVKCARAHDSFEPDPHACQRDFFADGGIGCGSGASEEDLVVAWAALAAIGAEIPDDDVREG
jgi:hypothetical protein